LEQADEEHDVAEDCPKYDCHVHAAVQLCEHAEECLEEFQACN
jgi:hypothetical protein